MGRSRGGGSQIQRVIKEVPEEAKPYLYGSGNRYLTQDEYAALSPEEQAGIETTTVGGVERYLNPDYVQGLLPRAQELFTGQMPGYEIAGFSPLQQRAFQLGEAGIGAYQPYLNTAAQAQRQGLTATEQALDATRALAGQIPGEIAAGQKGILGYGMGAADQIFGLSGRGQSIAERAARQMTAAAERGRDFAGMGISKSDVAAQRARRSTAGAQRALMEAGQFGRGAAGAGIASLRGAAGQYDPRSAAAFYNPFETQAVSAALGDIERAGARQLEDVRQQTEAEALTGGAFSGTRRFLERFDREDPIREEILRRQATTAAGLRQAGFESAAQRAQQAFEQARGRQIQSAGVMGQLGQAGAGTQITAAGQAGQLGLGAEQLAQRGALGGAELGLRGEQQAGMFAQGAGQLGLAGLAQDVATAQAAGQMGMQAAGQSANLGLQGITTGLGAQQQAAGMGQGIGSLGMQMANLGGMQQQMNMADVNLLSQLGGQQQRYAQSVLDARRATAMLPYQQVGFFSDIIQGAPIGTAQTSFMPGPSPFQQALGGAIAYGNLNRSGYI